MKLWILSDLHFESCDWDLPASKPDYDVLIAAGDIHDPASLGITWLAARSGGKPVIYVPSISLNKLQFLPCTEVKI